MALVWCGVGCSVLCGISVVWGRVWWGVALVWCGVGCGGCGISVGWGGVWCSVWH